MNLRFQVFDASNNNISSAPSLLMEGITGTSTEVHSSFDSLTFESAETPGPEPMLLLPVQQRINIGNYSVKDNDGINTAVSLDKKSQIAEIASKINKSKPKKNTGKCNFFKGKWVPDPKGPVYSNVTCAYIQGHQNCIKNGRPDRDYLHWRWKPSGCALPRFNATTFLELVRGKVWAFVGDSVARNQMQSLLCMLSQVETPKNTYKDEANLFVHWLFPSYNFTLMVLWSPYLVENTEGEFKGIPQGVTKLHLDVLGQDWVTLLPDMDVIILSTGQWFLKSGVYIMQDEVVGCHSCSGINAKQLGFYFAYRNAIKATLEGISLLPGFKGIAFLQTFTVDHFENGQWDTGGTCNRTQPYKKNEARLEGINKEMHKIVVEEYTNGTKEEAPNGSLAKLVDITYLGFLRPDGHPGRYRDFDSLSGRKNDQPTPNDCLHWCLPGPIDTWNEILLQMVREV
eukprot:Gb_25866 [translate_table: standard]